jgi:NAD(P)-dependent dehydrogenase (short-subunit alcohol dehydrogenase family)
MILDKKVALITGAGAGIGAQIAGVFAREGASVCVLDIDGAAAAATAAAVTEKGGAALAIEADLRHAGRIREAVEAATVRFGRVDVLVNNAALTSRQNFLDMTGQQWDDMLAVSLKGAAICSQLVLPQMMARKSGKIVNISSVTFHIGMTDVAHYIASKGGLIGLTRALAREFGQYNVHVNCITPGAVETEREARVATRQQVDAIVAQQSLARRIVPLDIARVCVFLASGMSDGITGQTLNVDGGWVMY